MSRVRRAKRAGRRLSALIFVLVSVFCIIFFSERGRFEPAISRQIVSTVLSPFQQAVSFVDKQIIDARNFIWDVVTVYDQNKALREEVERLRQENLTASEYAAENERLRALVSYKQSALQFDLLPSRVIGREAATWSSMIVIDKGAVDGVQQNMTVVNHQGLVGHVTAVSLNSSQVQLILDPRSSVGTLVQRAASRVTGIVVGNLSNANMPSMVNIPKTADVLEGDVVVTSGFGGVYPKGLVVGSITALENDPGGLLKRGHLTPAVDFGRLEDVAVIIKSREAPPEPLRPPKEAQKQGGGKK